MDSLSYTPKIGTIDLDAGLDSLSAKEKKNERERRRRLQVSHGFNDLFKILQLPESKMEKSTVLNGAVERLRELHGLHLKLVAENKHLRGECGKRGIKI